MLRNVCMEMNIYDKQEWTFAQIHQIKGLKAYSIYESDNTLKDMVTYNALLWLPLFAYKVNIQVNNFVQLQLRLLINLLWQTLSPL